MAIQRCVQHGLDATFGTVSINLGPETARGFEGPKLPLMNADGIYVPYHAKLPAIDLVLKQGKSVFGVQIQSQPCKNRQWGLPTISNQTWGSWSC